MQKFILEVTFAFRALFNYVLFYRYKEYTQIFGESSVTFDTSDVYSKYWFYPRYIESRHEPHVTDIIVALLNVRSTFVDIGANLGYFTCIASKLSREVHCFEMVPSFRKLIQRNIELNKLGNVTIYDAAVTDTRGIATYQSGLFKNAGMNIATTGGGRSIQTINLDSVNLPPTGLLLVKIDVEGAETLVIRGAVRLLEARRNSLILLIEVHPMQLAAYSSSKEELYDLLTELKYIVYVIREKRNTQRAALEPISRSRYALIKENFMILACSESSNSLIEDLVDPR